MAKKGEPIHDVTLTPKEEKILDKVWEVIAKRNEKSHYWGNEK